MKQIFDQVFYLWCTFHNRKPFSHLDPKITLKQFFPENTEDISDTHGSPSRILSDLFWKRLPWNTIANELGTISVFDTGCGSGNYGAFLQSVSNNHIDSYKGIDVYEHQNWKHLRENPMYCFETYNGKQVHERIPEKTNFFMSQSAIEHFQNDLHYFHDVKKFIEAHPHRAMIQVHLVPSAACMKLYGRHGYRQYTPRTISKITKLFPNAQCILYGLGGSECIRIHDEYIVKPLAKTGLDFRKTKQDEYKTEVLSAIRADAKQSTNHPNFYALVICSNWNEPFSI